MKPQASSKIAADILLQIMDELGIDSRDAKTVSAVLEVIDDCLREDRSRIVEWYRSRVKDIAAFANADVEAKCAACGAPVIKISAGHVKLFTFDAEHHDVICAHRKAFGS